MNTLNQPMLVSGVMEASSRAGQAVRVVGRKLIPYPIIMRARGYVRVPCAKPFTNPWVPAAVAKAQQEQRERAAHRREYAPIVTELRQLWADNGVQHMRGRCWGDVEMPPLPEEDPVCRPLPKGRMTPVQLREWIATGYRNCRNAREARRYEAHVDAIRRDYFAQLPDCVFVPAVRREHDEAQLREFRAGFKAAQAQRELREEIRVKQALRIDYQRQPQLHFRTRAEQIAEMKTLGRDIKALERRLAPAAVTEVVLDGRLWPEAGTWATVVSTGKAPVKKVTFAEVVKQKTTAEIEEEARLARWKKMQERESKPSAEREEWHVKKAIAKRPRKELDESETDTGFNYWREMNY